MASDMEDYQDKYRKLYSSLPLGEEQSRILHVRSAPELANPVVCTLEVIRLTPSPEKPYEAISYTWGSEPIDTIVTCNGLSLRVTRSCREAIQATRSKTDDLYIWIDQLCIDQTSNLEKSQQVAMMGVIYRHATCVNAWLGPTNILENGVLQRGSLAMHLDGSFNLKAASNVNEGELVTFISKDKYATAYLAMFEGALRDMAEVSQDPNTYYESRCWDPRLRDKTFLGSEDGHRMIETLSIQWTLFWNLLERPYFRRRWIVQEVVMARDVNFMVGTLTFSWPFFERVVAELSSLQARNVPLTRSVNERLNTDVIDLIVEPMQTLRRLRSIWNDTKDDSQLTPMSVFHPSASSLVSLPHDFVYAFYSMLQSASKPPTPNYTLAARDVFLAYTKWLIGEGFGEHFISNFPMVFTRRPGFPSWCIDFLPQVYVGIWRAELWPASHGTMRCDNGVLDKTMTSHSLRSHIPKEDLDLKYGRLDIEPSRLEMTCSSTDENELYVGGFILDRIAYVLQRTEVASTPKELVEQANAFFMQHVPHRDEEAHQRFHECEISVSTLCKHQRPSERLLTYLCGPWMCERSVVVENTEKPLSHAEFSATRATELLTYLWGKRSSRDSITPEDCCCITFAVTEHGWPAILRAEARSGDEIAVLNGVTKPMVTRVVDEQGRRVLVSESIVTGVMHGNLRELSAAQHLQQFVFI